MKIFGVRQVFNLFRRNAKAAQPEVEEVLDPKVQAYLDYLRDHGREVDLEAPREEHAVLALPWAA